MKEDALTCFRGGSAWRHAAMALAVLVGLAHGGPARAGSDDAVFKWAETYAGVFGGFGRADGRVVDTDGFSYSANAGGAVDYHDSGVIGGALIGKKFELGGVPFRIELDGTFGDLSAKTTRIDPKHADETVKSEFQWIATARAGVEQAIGPATVFVSGGLATAGINNSLIDLDRSCVPAGDLGGCRPTPWRRDPDDSFHDGSTEIGWVVSVGIETSLTDAWTLRLEGSYLDFGARTHDANRSGDDPCCGSGSSRRPVSYDVENKLGLMRLAIIRQFSL